MREIYQQALSSTVWVRAADKSGTGFLVDRSRKLVMTNYHVVGDHQTAAVFFPLYQGGSWTL